MTYMLNAAGTDIVIHEATDPVVGMPAKSLEEHLEKHPDIASTPEGYLQTAAEVIKHGRPYKNGNLYKGIYVRAHPSQEIGCHIVYTVHRRFPDNK
jgi:hypothetical protein